MSISSTIKPDKMSLSTFVRQIDLPSLQSPRFQKWTDARKKLSDLAWDIHSANAYAHYRALNSISDVPPIARTGVFDQGRLSAEDTESLFRLFQECPIKPYSADNFCDGYSFDPTGSLETYNTYRSMTSAFESKLREVLRNIAPQVEQICGHYFRIVSSHIWSLNAGPRRYQWHLDWWPVALKKLFIYPSGIDESKGSTAFRLKSGEEKVIQGPPGTWVIFENSAVAHKGVESLIQARPTIAISIAPSFRTDIRLFDAGTNSGYPWFPAEYLPTSGQEGNADYFSPDSLHLRTLKRVVELAGLDVTLTADGMVEMPVPAKSEATPTAGVPALSPGWMATLWRRLGAIRRRLLARQAR